VTLRTLSFAMVSAAVVAGADSVTIVRRVSVLNVGPPVSTCDTPACVGESLLPGRFPRMPSALSMALINHCHNTRALT
jgi:hypothetical protein